MLPGMEDGVRGARQINSRFVAQGRYQTDHRGYISHLTDKHVYMTRGLIVSP